MIKFGRIIDVAGFNPSDYPSLSDALVNLVDLRNHKLETVKNEPLFGKNPNSQKEFEAFLKEPETDEIFSKTNVKIQLTEGFLLICFFPKRRANLYLPRF